MIDNNLILDLMNEKISILPDKQNLKTIANASEGRITYTYLCEVCGYSEIELSSNFTWRNFYPERGCIYYIDLGTNTIGFEQKGIRPCVIISNDKGNRAGGIVTVAPITSQGKNKIPSHVYITKQDGMKENSTILIEQTRVVDKRRFFYNGTPIRILQLSEQKISEVNTAIEIQFGLENVIYNEEIAFKLIDQINALKQNENINKKLVELLDEKIDELINYCSKYNKNYKAVIEEYNIINNYSFAI
jgi:mRNA interferase MazF